MLLSKEIYRDEYSQRIKKIFYNDKQQIIGTIEVFKSDGKETGHLNVHEYTGESYRLITYKESAKAYAHFISHGHAVLGKTGWHSTDEAHSIQEFKYGNGLLIASTYRDENGATSSSDYSYQNGMKVSETNVSVDGSVTKINYTYQGKTLLSKATFINGRFADQFNYIYNQQNQLTEEQQFLMHKETLYLSAQKNFFYNVRKELEKTQYYGRYDGKMYLYKVEEKVQKGNERNIRLQQIPDVEMVIGYYDLAAMHEYLKQHHMEWAVGVFSREYMTTAKMQLLGHNIEKIDEQGSIVESKMINPENNQEVGRVLYRNEYNEASLPEFVICYRVLENGMPEESSITKYYYKD